MVPRILPCTVLLLLLGTIKLMTAQSQETLPRSVYASPWQGGIIPVLVCDKYNDIQVLNDVYIEYVKSQRELAITNGRSAYLHDPMPKPDPRELGCSEVAPGTPMTLVDRVYGVPMVTVRLPEGHYRTGMTAPWAIFGPPPPPPPCTNCPAQLIKMVPAQYPELAQEALLTGKVVLSLIIDQQGNAHDVKVESNNLSRPAINHQRLSRFPAAGPPYPTVPFGQPCPFEGFAIPSGDHAVCTPMYQRPWRKRVQKEIAEGLRTDPSLGLDQKAVEAVSHWRFKPEIKDGKPVSMRTHVEMDFDLTRIPAPGNEATLPMSNWRWLPASATTN